MGELVVVLADQIFGLFRGYVFVEIIIDQADWTSPTGCKAFSKFD